MDSINQRIWALRGEEPDAALVARLQDEHGLSALVAHLLASRGFDLQTAQPFLDARLADLPDPANLPDIDVAVSRLQRALADDEPISIHGDYDVDGISGTVLLVDALRSFGGQQVDYHIPLRLRDGYGLSAEAIEETSRAGTRLVITVDCGVSAIDEAELAKRLGIDLIITDHHQPPEELPPAVAVINPQRTDSRFPFCDLAGVGVAFFLVVALRQRLRESGWFESRAEPDLRHLLDLVALGTIADLVPLQGVNRTLVKAGLMSIDKGARVGLRALKQVAGIQAVSTSAVGFQLAPRLNAVGRLEDAARGVELLLEQDMVRAMTTARQLDLLNRERRELEQKTLKEAEKAVGRLPESTTHSIVLADPGWHPGVIGIVASRLVERFYRPTVLIALDGESGKGSCRSIRGFHLYQSLQECAGSLTAFGGHEMAAGLSLTAKDLPLFSEQFETVARRVLTDEELVPTFRHDGVMLLEEIDLAAVKELERLAPYGMGNPEPLLVVESVTARQLQQMGAEKTHLRFTACQGGYSHPAVAFGMAERMEDFESVVDLLVSPQVNEYKGRRSVQLRVKDVREASGA